MGVTVDYACADGTPFPVTFASEDDAARQWRLEQEHMVGPMTPLARSVDQAGRAGSVRAYNELGLPYATFWDATVDAHGWPYFADGPMDAETMTAMFTGCAALVERHGGAHGVWAEDSLPKVRERCAWLQSEPDVPFAALAEAASYAHHNTMISAFITGNDVRLLTETLTGVVDAPALVALELSQGYENETMRANQRLHELGRMDRTSPEFVRALDAFLDEYGWRAELWTIDFPTWRERTAGFWAVLDACASGDAPVETVRRAAARRDALVEDLSGRFREEAERARFLRRVARMATYTAVREDRAMWQLIAMGSLRHAVLARARSLVASGALVDPHDVFFLWPEEVDDPSRIDRDVVAERRAEHERWAAVRPPLAIGDAPSPAPAPTERVLRGTAASRGVARGTARVILDLADADRLQPGEILVCSSTAPPWTPLFCVAAALVTDVGDLASHPAIAAREYGLPCVVAVERATQRIPDGAEIVVDGAAGTVELV